MKIKHRISFALAALAILLAGGLAFAATPDRYTGPRESYTCSIEAIGNTEDLDYCSFAMPQAAIIENVQAHCLTIVSDPQFLIDSDLAVDIIYVAAVNFAASGVILAPAIAVASVADEAIIDFHVDADGGDSATHCSITITWSRQ